MDRMTRATLWIAARYWDRLRIGFRLSAWMRPNARNRYATCKRSLHLSKDRLKIGRYDPDRSGPVSCSVFERRASGSCKENASKTKAWAFKEAAATSQERASLRSGCLPRFQWSGRPPFAALVGLPRRRPCIRYIAGCHRHGRSGLQHKPCKLTRARTP
jgi:hypothetical protein